MGRQKSLIKITGTLDDLSFYKTEDGHLVRMKGGVTADRIRKDPAFARTRENIAEFRELSRVGKLIRSAFRTIIGKSADSKATSRMIQILSKILKEDNTNRRGERQVAIAMQSPNAKNELIKFNFNAKSNLSQIFKSTFAVDDINGIITINDFNPSNDVIAPEGMSHCILETAWVKVDLTSEEFTSASSPERAFDLRMAPAQVVLTPSQAPFGSGILVIALKLSFTQSMNGVQYDSNNTAHTAIAFVHVR